MPTTLKKLVRARMEKTGESYQQALRHVRAEDGSRREAPQIILGPAGRRLPPWVPEQDDQAFQVARMAADRQRRNIAAILAQQGEQVLPPLPTVAQSSGNASVEIRLTGVAAHAEVGTIGVQPARVEIVGIGEILSAQLAADPTMLHRLSPDQFEEFVCDRLAARNLEAKRVGGVYDKDGGIDIVFWPKPGAFPFLGAVQVKHHRDPSAKEGSGSVRNFAGAIAGHGFGAAILATNTGFTPDAKWYASKQSGLIWLRDFEDMKRWIANDFADREERRDLPDEIELCPGVVVKISR